MVHSSVMAIAAYPSAFARATNSSGLLAPLKNEKLERHRSSAYWGNADMALVHANNPCKNQDAAVSLGSLC